MANETNQVFETLRTFAFANSEIAFAHLCTAALAGDALAIAMVIPVATQFGKIDSYALLDLMAATDTTRPDGAIARSIKL